jgi:hypothetical protein
MKVRTTPSLSTPEPSPTGSKKANSVAVAPFAKNEELFGIFEKILNVLMARWPKKTAACVHHEIGVSERAVQFWFARQTGLSLENVIALLRSDEGYEILKALMGNSQAEWWLTTQNAHDLRKTRREIAAAQRRIDALKARQSQIDLFDQ